MVTYQGKLTDLPAVPLPSPAARATWLPVLWYLMPAVDMLSDLWTTHTTGTISKGKHTHVGIYLCWYFYILWGIVIFNITGFLSENQPPIYKTDTVYTQCNHLSVMSVHCRVEKMWYFQKLLHCVAISHVEFLCIELQMCLGGLQEGECVSLRALLLSSWVVQLV